MEIYFSLLIAVIGLVIYLLATVNARAAEIGRIMFWTGLLAFLMTAPGHMLSIVR